MFSGILRLIMEPFMRLFMYVWVGFNVQNRDRLPRSGPAIIVALHNSHLDTLGLRSLLPWWLSLKVRPVAAADYFLKGRMMSWFSQEIMRIIPIRRGGIRIGDDIFAPCREALKRKQILVIYPEGSRGEPEQMQPPKKGIAWLAEQCPDVPVYFVGLAGLGKVLGKGDLLPIPFLCDVIVDEPMYGSLGKDEFMRQLEAKMVRAQAELKVKPWV